MRPEGWENRWAECLKNLEERGWIDPDIEKYVAGSAIIYEAGADAMLEGLKKEAVKLSVAGQEIELPKGYLVFIEE